MAITQLISALFLVFIPHGVVFGTTSVEDFVGIGYDLLKGNPEGDFTEGGIDPGYRLSRNIFKRTYEEGKEGLYNGETVKIPDQMEYQTLSSCSSKETTSVYHGTESYQKKLDINTDVEASGSYGLFDFRFSLSTGYSEVSSSVESKEIVIMDKVVTCSEGWIRYLLSTALHTDEFTVSDDFYYSVKNLPTSYDEDDYIQFIKNWGTHYVEEVNAGGRLITRFQSTYEDLYQYASENVEASLSAGGEYAGYSGSFTIDMDEFNEHVSESTTFGSETTSIKSGSKIVQEEDYWIVPSDDTNTPVPISCKLKYITKVFDERLWKVTPDGETYESLEIATKLANVEKALEQYPSVANAVSSSDPVLQFPNAWPDGSYSLPKADSGCPSGGDGFKWYEGHIRQDNEDDNNKNGCPNPFNLAGSCDRNLDIYYCSKTVTSSDYGILWPKGSYCIAKKDTCPEQMSEAYVYWDDEDSDNKNKKSGVLPDGTYDRNTRIQYCCRSDEHPHHEIILPTEKDFFLIRNHVDGCQHVAGMTESLQVVKTDDEDKNNKNKYEGVYGAEGKNHYIGYCYYTPAA